MASNRTKIAVGLFVLIGLAVAISAILWLGMSNYFQTGDQYAAYFDESVQGLERDSAVKYRGVTVGRVERIGLAPDATLVEVIFTLEPDAGLQPEKNMTAQLQSVGITGIMYLALDRTGDDAEIPSPDLGFEPAHPAVPTRPSDLQRLFRGVNSVLDQINALEVDEISKKIQSAFDTISRAVDAADIKAVSTDIRTFFAALDNTFDRDRIRRIMTSLEKTAAHLEKATAGADGIVAEVRGQVSDLLSAANRILGNLQGTAGDLNALVSDNRGEISRTLAQFRRSLETAEAFLEAGSRTLAASREQLSYFQRSLTIILQNLEKTSETLKAFAETIAAHPAQLLLGEPPPRRPIEGNDR
jgi:phospholipid/cholesterol/gamma-HCH transport system substrate-binding protein